MSHRLAGLKVEVAGARLAITIGIDTLVKALKASAAWKDTEADHRGWQVRSADALANDVVRVLEHEQEDGTTLVHLLLDRAFDLIIDQGYESISFGAEA